MEKKMNKVEIFGLLMVGAGLISLVIIFVVPDFIRHLFAGGYQSVATLIIILVCMVAIGWYSWNVIKGNWEVKQEH